MDNSLSEFMEWVSDRYAESNVSDPASDHFVNKLNSVMREELEIVGKWVDRYIKENI